MTRESKIVIPVHRPKLSELLFFLISGVVVSVPLTLFVTNFTDPFCVTLPLKYAEICSIIIFTPFVEELAKAFPLFYRHGETTRSIFVLGFLTGFGFGITEFYYYVVTFQAPVIVRLPAVFFHASNTGIVSYGVGRKNPIPFYLTSVGLHFANNFFAVVATDLWFTGGPLVLLASFSLAWYLYGKTKEKPIPY